MLLIAYEHLEMMWCDFMCPFGWTNPSGGMKWQKNWQHPNIWSHCPCATLADGLEAQNEFEFSKAVSGCPILKWWQQTSAALSKASGCPALPSSPPSANACICNVPQAALSPPATCICCQPAIHGKALIWRQAGAGAKVGSRKKVTSQHHRAHPPPPTMHCGLQLLPSTHWLWEPKHCSGLPCVSPPLCQLIMQNHAVELSRLQFISSSTTWGDKAACKLDCNPCLIFFSLRDFKNCKSTQSSKSYFIGRKIMCSFHQNIYQ